MAILRPFLTESVVPDASRDILTGVFFGTAFATILTPGPNMLYVGASGAQRGPAVGALAAVAVTVGGVCYTVATAIGISAAIAAHPSVFTVIRAAGIAYLVWLGFKLLIHVRDTAPAVPLPTATGRAFRGGLVISLTNPQLALFFLAFLPQFVVAERTPVWLQLLELGLTFNACAFVVVLAIGALTGTAGRRVVGIKFRQVMRVIAGLAFLLLAIRSTYAMMH